MILDHVRSEDQLAVDTDAFWQLQQEFDPDLLILDEPASALDPLAEGDVKAAAAEFARGRTTFIVSHRLSTIASADRILVLAAADWFRQAPTRDSPGDTACTRRCVGISGSPGCLRQPEPRSASRGSERGQIQSSVVRPPC